jgi:uncharacterized protein (DUF1330 family)
MTSKLKITVAAVLGLIVGGVAIQGAHAQTTPKVYSISEYTTAPPPATREKLTAAGGHTLYTVNGPVTAIDGTAPKHVGILEWDSMDAATKWFKSSDAPKADRRYLIEAEANAPQQSAQTKPKAYVVTEFDELPRGDARPGITKAGGRPLYTLRGKITTIDGTAPKYVGINEWDSVDAAKGWAKSPDAPGKPTRRYMIETESH